MIGRETTGYQTESRKPRDAFSTPYIVMAGDADDTVRYHADFVRPTLCDAALPEAIDLLCMVVDNMAEQHDRHGGHFEAIDRDKPVKRNGEAARTMLTYDQLCNPILSPRPCISILSSSRPAQQSLTL